MISRLTVFKLFKLRKNGTYGPLFINSKQVIPIGEWLTAECYPTKGFKTRQGWHTTGNPNAPHLSSKNRIWVIVEIEDYEEFPRPEIQGGMWYIAQKMRVVGPLMETKDDK